MNEPIIRHEEKPALPAAPQMPFQAPAVVRDPLGPKDTGEGADGVAANINWGGLVRDLFS
ncbi:hypothetical protein ACIGFK_17110 [Streptomyces sp. NPDC085524]|uniref:hypothetical protein n=1 Tax=unclassified Streptomyces TaxID=2593676 RepID=UPI0035E37504